MVLEERFFFTKQFGGNIEFSIMQLGVYLPNNRS